MATIHILVKGKVQGVFYRATARERAKAMHLEGWVRNTSDGDVEMMVQGNAEQVQQFVDWCRKGPDRARVEDIEVTEVAAGDFKDFIIRTND